MADQDVRIDPVSVQELQHRAGQMIEAVGESARNLPPGWYNSPWGEFIARTLEHTYRLQDSLRAGRSAGLPEAESAA